jgi:hypothetical protein
MDILDLLSKPGSHYRYHGVRNATLTLLLCQAQDNQIVLWGQERDEHVSELDYEGFHYIQGGGYLYTSLDEEMCYENFCDEGGIVLVLEKQIETPFELILPTDRRQRIVKCAEWRVIGGVRPYTVLEDDGFECECIDAFSLEEIRALYGE